MESRLTTSDYRNLAILLVIVGACYFLTLRHGHDWGSDFSMYIAHARNIATGRPYMESPYIPDTVSRSSIHMPAKYPPVFPLLLAPVYWAYGLNIFAFKAMGGILLLLALVAYYLLARLRGLSSLLSLFAMIGFGLSEIVLNLKESVLSDGPYLFFAGVALTAIVYVYGKGLDETRPVLSAAVVAVLMLLGYGTRATGITLLLAFCLHELWRARRIRLFAVVTVGIFGLGMVLLALTLYDSRFYGNQFPFLPKAYLSNVIYYLHSPASLWGGAPRLFRYPVAVLSMVIVAIQFARMLPKPSVVEFYMLISILMIIVYSLGQADRYALPVYPLFFIYLAESAQWFAERTTWNWRAWAIPAFCVLASVGAVFNVAALQRGPITEGVDKPTFHSLCDFINAKTDPNNTLVSWNPRVLALYTGRHTAWYVHTPDDGKFDGFLDSLHASYVVVYRGENEDQLWLAPHIQHEPAHFVPVYENPDFRVYQVAPQPQPAAKP